MATDCVWFFGAGGAWPMAFPMKAMTTMSSITMKFWIDLMEPFVGTNPIKKASRVIKCERKEFGGDKSSMGGFSLQRIWCKMHSILFVFKDRS